MSATKELLHGSPYDGQEHTVPFGVFPQAYQKRIIRNLILLGDIVDVYVDGEINADSRPFINSHQMDNLRKDYNKKVREGQRVDAEKHVSGLVDILGGIPELRIVNRTEIIREQAASLLAEAQEIFRANNS
jgi:hypothetical protein